MSGQILQSDIEFLQREIENGYVGLPADELIYKLERLESIMFKLIPFFNKSMDIWSEYIGDAQKRITNEAIRKGGNDNE